MRNWKNEILKERIYLIIKYKIQKKLTNNAKHVYCRNWKNIS